MTLTDPQILVRVSYLAVLADDEASDLASRLAIRSYGPRQLVLSAGEPATAVYVMQSGRARIIRVSPGGREHTLRLLAPGDSFGEVPIFDGLPTPASVETIEPSEVIVLPAEVLLGLVQSHREVAAGLLRHFARRLRGFTDLIEQISLQTVQARLARYLYQLAREEGTDVANGVRVPREVTQQDLASMLGAAREVVARTLRSMADDGILTLERTAIVIHQPERLRELA